MGCCSSREADRYDYEIARAPQYGYAPYNNNYTAPTPQYSYTVASYHETSPYTSASNYGATSSALQYKSTDVTVSRVNNLAPLPLSAPTCRHCGGIGRLHTVKHSNPNGNTGRPYYKCSSCGAWISFADEGGNDMANPLCECGLPSRRQRAGVRSRNPGGIHYVCENGGCDFYAEEIDELGRQARIPRPLVGAYSATGYI